MAFQQPSRLLPDIGSATSSLSSCSSIAIPSGGADSTHHNYDHRSADEVAAPTPVRVQVPAAVQLADLVDVLSIDGPRAGVTLADPARLEQLWRTLLTHPVLRFPRGTPARDEGMAAVGAVLEEAGRAIDAAGGAALWGGFAALTVDPGALANTASPPRSQPGRAAHAFARLVQSSALPLSLLTTIDAGAAEVFPPMLRLVQDAYVVAVTCAPAAPSAQAAEPAATSTGAVAAPPLSTRGVVDRCHRVAKVALHGVAAMLARSGSSGASLTGDWQTAAATQTLAPLVAEVALLEALHPAAVVLTTGAAWAHVGAVVGRRADDGSDRTAACCGFVRAVALCIDGAIRGMARRGLLDESPDTAVARLGVPVVALVVGAVCHGTSGAAEARRLALTSLSTVPSNVLTTLLDGEARDGLTASAVPPSWLHLLAAAGSHATLRVLLSSPSNGVTAAEATDRDDEATGRAVLPDEALRIAANTPDATGLVPLAAAAAIAACPLTVRLLLCACGASPWRGALLSAADDRLPAYIARRRRILTAGNRTAAAAASADEGVSVHKSLMLRSPSPTNTTTTTRFRNDDELDGGGTESVDGAIDPLHAHCAALVRDAQGLPAKPVASGGEDDDDADAVSCGGLLRHPQSFDLCLLDGVGEPPRFDPSKILRRGVKPRNVGFAVTTPKKKPAADGGDTSEADNEDDAADSGEAGTDALPSGAASAAGAESNDSQWTSVTTRARRQTAAKARHAAHSTQRQAHAAAVDAAHLVENARHGDGDATSDMADNSAAFRERMIEAQHIAVAAVGTRGLSVLRDALARMFKRAATTAADEAFALSAGGAVALSRMMAKTAHTALTTTRQLLVPQLRPVLVGAVVAGLLAGLEDTAAPLDGILTALGCVLGVDKALQGALLSSNDTSGATAARVRALRVEALEGQRARSQVAAATAMGSIGGGHVDVSAAALDAAAERLVGTCPPIEDRGTWDSVAVVAPAAGTSRRGSRSSTTSRSLQLVRVFVAPSTVGGGDDASDTGASSGLVPLWVEVVALPGTSGNAGASPSGSSKQRRRETAVAGATLGVVPHASSAAGFPIASGSLVVFTPPAVFGVRVAVAVVEPSVGRTVRIPARWCGAHTAAAASAAPSMLTAASPPRAESSPPRNKAAGKAAAGAASVAPTSSAADAAAAKDRPWWQLAFETRAAPSPDDGTQPGSNGGGGGEAPTTAAGTTPPATSVTICCQGPAAGRGQERDFPMPSRVGRLPPEVVGELQRFVGSAPPAATVLDDLLQACGNGKLRAPWIEATSALFGPFEWAAAVDPPATPRG